MLGELHKNENFPTTYEGILQRIATIDPIGYGSSRNYLDGAVSYLSPYISRGVISTKLIFEHLKAKNYYHCKSNMKMKKNKPTN